MNPTKFTSVFFDLDGTLADTAPDLAAAANKMLLDRGQLPLPLAQLRPLASSGARGMIHHAFGITPEDVDFEAMREEFLDNYEQAIHVHTQLFEGVETILERLDLAQIPWGIVTNKHSRFTTPLVASMGLGQRTPAIVSGDTTPHAKPHPTPLLHAANLHQVTPINSIYVGDDHRDIVAGKAAGMKTVAAAYGYCGNDIPVSDWGADFIIHHPKELLDILF